MLTEIQSIMSDGNMGTRSGTKDVFREMDGFLALVSTLSTAHMASDSPIQEPEEQVQREMLGAIQLTLVILAETMHDHEENASYFKVSRAFGDREFHTQSSKSTRLVTIHCPKLSARWP